MKLNEHVVHKASRLRAIVCGYTIDAEEGLSTVDLAFPYRPTEEQVAAVGVTIRRDADWVHCCAVGKLSYPQPCPLHRMTSQLVTGAPYAETLHMTLRQFEHEWEEE